MKRILLPVLFFIIVILPARGQDSLRTHKGFHLEFGIGPAFGSIHTKQADGAQYEVDFTGTGLDLEFRAGYGISKNLVLTADFINRVIYQPHYDVNGVTGVSNYDYTIREYAYGAGVTWYKMPADLFAGITLGLGQFTFQNNTVEENFDMIYESGFSWQVRAGKHWWFSDKWGFSLAAAYGMTTAIMAKTHPLIDWVSEDVTSSRFSIVLGVGLR